jgi:hypothetical protein
MTKKVEKVQKLGPRQERWVRALESGQYKQATSVLHNEENQSFCCLGVACDIIKNDDLNEDLKTDVKNALEFMTVLPPFVIDYYGLIKENGQHKENNTVCLTYMNDNGESFAEIAKVIRANPEYWFEEPK